MNLRANHHGFLIPDRALASIDDALQSINTHLGNIAHLLEAQQLARVRVEVLPLAVQQIAPAQIQRTRRAPSLQQRSEQQSEQSSGQRSGQSTRQNLARSPSHPAVEQQQATRRQLARSTQTRPAQAEEVTQVENNTAAQTRDPHGRFAAQGLEHANHENDQAPGELTMQDKLNQTLSHLANLPALAGDANQLDPALDAMLEMKNVLEGPIKLLSSAGTAMLGMRSKTAQEARAQVATPWHKRMLKAMGLARSETSAFQRATLRQRDRQSVATAPMVDSGIIASSIKMLFSPIGALAVSALGAWLYTARDKLSDAMVTGMQTLTATWENAVKGMSNTWDAIQLWAKAKLDVLGDDVGAISTSVKDKLSAAVQVAKDTLAPIAQLGPIAPLVQTTINLSNKAKAMSKEVKTEAQTLANKTSETIQDTAQRTQAAGGSLLEKVLPKGYRHKAMFDGIKGGESLTKNGSYTDDEAQQIRTLKASSANTSANLKGGMPALVQQKIIDQAKAAGLNPEMMLQIAAMESGGNANAISSTGAIGIYQFTGKTATGVGIKNRFDVDENIAGGMKLTLENKQALQTAKLPVSTENLYMMHQLGPTAAQEIIRGAQKGTAISSLSPAAQKAVSLNYGAQAKTAKEYLAKNQAALANRANEVIGKSQVGFLPTGGAATATPTPAIAPTAPPVSVVAPTGVSTIAPALATQMKSAIAAKPPTPIAPPPAPQVETAMRLNSAQPLEVIVRNEQAVAQDVPDRRLAAIASGGLGQM